jgi:hypothetical protein
MNSAWVLWSLLVFAEAASAFDLQSGRIASAREKFLQHSAQQNASIESYLEKRLKKPSRIQLKKRKGVPPLQFEPGPGSKRKRNYKVSS